MGERPFVTRGEKKYRIMKRETTAMKKKRERKTVEEENEGTKAGEEGRLTGKCCGYEDRRTTKLNNAGANENRKLLKSVWPSIIAIRNEERRKFLCSCGQSRASAARRISHPQRTPFASFALLLPAGLHMARAGSRAGKQSACGFKNQAAGNRFWRTIIHRVLAQRHARASAKQKRSCAQRTP